MVPMLMGAAARMLKPSESKKEVNKKITASKFVSKSSEKEKKSSSIVKAGTSSIVAKPSVKLVPRISLPPAKETKAPQGKVSFDYLNKILDTLVKNTSTLLKISKSEYDSGTKSADAERRSKQLEKKREREERAETASKVSEEKRGLKIKGPKIPGVFEFLKRFAIGTAIMQFLNWISDPNNKNSLFKFLEDNFLAIIIGSLTAIALAILAPIIGPMGMIFTVLKVLGGVAIGVGKIALGLAKAPFRARGGGPVRGRGSTPKGRSGTAKPPTPKKGVFNRMRGLKPGRGGLLTIAILGAQLFSPQIEDFFSGLYARFGFGIRTWDDNKLLDSIESNEKEIARLKEKYKDQELIFESMSQTLVVETAGYVREAMRRGLIDVNGNLIDKNNQKQQANIQQVSMQIPGPSPAATVQPQTTLVSQSSLPALPPTGIDPRYGAAQMYGASRRGGRKHAGQDFDAGPNDTFYSRIGGEVTNVDYDPNGYFNYVDIYNSDLDVTERVAEGDTILVKKGQTISAGTPIAKGTKTTGVFHYEIRKGRATTYGFTGTVDPIAFLSGLQTTQIAKAQPQKPAAKSAPAVAQYAPYEEPKREAALIPIPTQSGQQQQQKASGSGSPVLTYPVDPYQALNSYYNFQVLGFLYKQG